MGTRMLLRGGALADGTSADISIDAGMIVGVAPMLAPSPGATVVDLGGMVILPAPAEPHAHLDKVFTESSASGRVDDVADAVHTWESRTRRDAPATVAAARRAIDAMVANGYTAIRSHVEIAGAAGLDTARGLLELRTALREEGVAELQFVAMASSPLSGTGGAAQRRLLEEALDLGFDAAGAAPWRDADPAAATKIVLDAARRAGVPVDLHTDETLDPDVLTVRDLLRQIDAHDGGAGVTVSHCVSLGAQTAQVQQAIAAELAAAGVGVVTLPQTNLYLQARSLVTAPPRGLTALRALLDAGTVLAAGADNVRDVFCPVGRFDACETATLLVLAGHLSITESWAACSAGARRVMGLPPVEVAAGSPAELLCLRGESLVDAVASADGQRITIHRGEIVARTAVTRDLRRRASMHRLPTRSDPDNKGAHRCASTTR